MAKSKGGRPTDLNDKIKSIAIGLAEKGKTLVEIAATLRVSRSTLYNWLGKDQEFMDTLKASTHMADELVEVSLYMRACGYSHAEEKIFLTKDGDIVRAKTIKHYPPDPTSMIFWLKNRQPEKWRDKQEIEVTKDIPISIAADEQDL